MPELTLTELTLTELTLTDPSASTRTAALQQVQLALAMIIADPYARSLLASDPDAPSPSTGLTDWLYAHWWCGLPTDAAASTDLLTGGEPERGAARLEAGRRTTAPRSRGWLVLAAVGDVLVAARLGDRPDRPDGPEGPSASPRRITTTADAVVSSSRPGLPPRPGDLVTVRHGASGLDPEHGWWWAHSTRPEDLARGPLDRWYVHARDLSAAASLVPLLLAVAAEVDCPISLKCPPTDAGYGRRDALVVYLPRNSASRAEAALLRHAAQIEPLVRPEVPPLTRPLLAGVARAEDPGRGSSSTSTDGDSDSRDRGADDQVISYGQLRCGQVAAVAAALLRPASPSAGIRRLDDESIAAVLTSVGIDLDAIERVAE